MQNSSTVDYKPSVRPALRRSTFLGEVFRTILFVVAVTALFDMAIPRSLVDGRSMQPTFQDGERLIVSRLNFLLGKPERGDVIVFNSVQPHEVGVMLIKRVIGLPGETVSLINGQVHINGEPLEEPYIYEACRISRCPDETWQLGPSEYFVMGDNRNNSQDSRRFGPIPFDHIVGSVVFRYWTFDRLGLIAHHNYDS